MHSGDYINSQHGSVCLLTENLATNRAPNPAQCDTPMGSERITLLWELVTASKTTVRHLRLSWMQVWDILITNSTISMHDQHLTKQCQVNSVRLHISPSVLCIKWEIQNIY